MLMRRCGRVFWAVSLSARERPESGFVENVDPAVGEAEPAVRFETLQDAVHDLPLGVRHLAEQRLREEEPHHTFSTVPLRCDPQQSRCDPAVDLPDQERLDHPDRNIHAVLGYGQNRALMHERTRRDFLSTR